MEKLLSRTTEWGGQATESAHGAQQTIINRLFASRFGVPDSTLFQHTDPLSVLRDTRHSCSLTREYQRKRKTRGEEKKKKSREMELARRQHQSLVPERAIQSSSDVAIRISFSFLSFILPSSYFLFCSVTGFRSSSFFYFFIWVKFGLSAESVPGQKPIKVSRRARLVGRRRWIEPDPKAVIIVERSFLSESNRVLRRSILLIRETEPSQRTGSKRQQQ